MHVGLGHGPSRFYSTTSTGRIHYCELDFENRSVKPRTDFTHGIRMPKNTVFLGLTLEVCLMLQGEIRGVVY